MRGRIRASSSLGARQAAPAAGDHSALRSQYATDSFGRKTKARFDYRVGCGSGRTGVELSKDVSQFCQIRCVR